MASLPNSTTNRPAIIVDLTLSDSDAEDNNQNHNNQRNPSVVASTAATSIMNESSVHQVARMSTGGRVPTRPVSSSHSNITSMAVSNTTNSSSIGTLTGTASTAAQKQKKTGSNKKNKNMIRLQAVDFDHDNPPPPGHICPSKHWYMTLDGETLQQIGDKLGLASYKILANIANNVDRFGPLKSTTKFRRNTAVRLPADQVSPWMCQKLVYNPKAEDEDDWDDEATPCDICHVPENPDDPNDSPMLLCDGCNRAVHLKCCRCPTLTAVPEHEWFCHESCLPMLQARRDAYGQVAPHHSLRARLPPLPAINTSTVVPEDLHARMLSHLQFMRDADLHALQQRHARQISAMPDEMALLSEEIRSTKVALQRAEGVYTDARRSLMRVHGIAEYKMSNLDETTILYFSLVGRWGRYRVGQDENSYQFQEGVRKIYQIQRELEEYERAVKVADKKYKEAAQQMRMAKAAHNKAPSTRAQEQQTMMCHYAAYLGEDRLEEFESPKMFADRPPSLSLLGLMKIRDEMEVEAIQMLQEPQRLIFLVPLAGPERINDVQKGQDYAIFGTAELFAATRDDTLPMSFAGTRGAQVRLYQMLLDDPRNHSIQVSQSHSPNSIRIRGETHNENCFELGELVRDCICDLGRPEAPTPPALSKQGLTLRQYQKQSLQFLLDKENEPTGLGFAGELWTRMQFLDSSGEYFFCRATGTFAKEIFNFRSDADKASVARPFGGFPTGSIIGSEMGLGKTIICLALIVANPPPLHNRLLPREHKYKKIEHPSYIPPPSVVGCTSSSAKRIFLSNGTLVIAPMTLCSQWQAEVEKFAPWLSVMTLHATESPKLENLASKDIVIASTFALQSHLASSITSKLRRVHFHRLLVDEAHYNQQGETIQHSIASISATHRHAVTGTPLGKSINDLGGLLRFIRVPQFCRKEFFKNCIAEPYHDRNIEALRVLRMILSRCVVRHSKEQTTSDGKAMLSLPPRTVETVLLKFGSEAEEYVYNSMEERNQKRFRELRKISPRTAAGKFIELTGMTYATRQACCHPALIDLYKLHELNISFQNEEKYKNGDRKQKASSKSAKKTRMTILAEAIEKALPSAQGRIREVVEEFQENPLQANECVVCLELINEREAVVTPCAHFFCHECVIKVLETNSTTRNNGRCPTCRAEILQESLTFLGEACDAGIHQPNKDEDTKEEAADPKQEFKLPAAPAPHQQMGYQVNAKDIHTTVTGVTERLDYERISKKDRQWQKNHLFTLTQKFLDEYEKARSLVCTKVCHLLNEIQIMEARDPTSKCVVFSQFLGVLDCASVELLGRGIPFVRVDGNMKQYERADALQEFSSNANVKVFLLSTRAGSVGLNLTAADHCFIMDPASNPSIEEQAIDRIHRIGQTRKVTVKRFIMENTVEERILAARRQLVQQHTSTGVAATWDDDRPQKRLRLENDEQTLDDRTLQRLKDLEFLMGCSTSDSSSTDEPDTTSSS